MNEPRKWLPPMSALTAFEAAVRHGGFSRAGEEIGLTQSAVSRQIAQLEAMLQTPLFDRIGRRVRLNDAGRVYADALLPALDRIRQATARAAARAPQTALRIATLPSFGMRWLAPRLPLHALCGGYGQPQCGGSGCSANTGGSAACCSGSITSVARATSIQRPELVLSTPPECLAG